MRIASAEIAKAWQSWASYASAMGASKEAMRRAARMFSPAARSMRMALTTWVGVMVQKRSMLRALTALVQSGLRSGFTTWAELASTLLSERERADRCLRKAVSALAQRGARAALNTWAELAAERAEATRRLLSAAAVFRSDGVRKAFNSWLDMSVQRAVMYRALAIFTQRGLSAGFAAWASSAEEAAEHAEVMRGAVHSPVSYTHLTLPTKRIV